MNEARDQLGAIAVSGSKCAGMLQALLSHGLIPEIHVARATELLAEYDAAASGKNDDPD